MKRKFENFCNYLEDHPVLGCILLGIEGFGIGAMFALAI